MHTMPEINPGPFVCQAYSSAYWAYHPSFCFTSFDKSHSCLFDLKKSIFCNAFEYGKLKGFLITSCHMQAFSIETGWRSLDSSRVHYKFTSNLAKIIVRHVLIHMYMYKYVYICLCMCVPIPDKAPSKHVIVKAE